MSNAEKYDKVKLVFSNRLLNNITWLFILNFINTIIPYFTFPYITRIFSPVGYGEISFAMAFIAYFQTFIDYGFNLTGARRVAIAENDLYVVSKIYTSITVTKLLFFLLSVPIIMLTSLYIPQIRNVLGLIYIFIFYALSSALMPTWLYQGLQKVKYITIISFIIRIIFLVLVFTLVKSKEDIILYSIIYSISFLAISIVAMIVSKVVLGINIVRVNFSDIKDMIIDGFYVFTSSAVIRVMGTTGIFVLGLFSTPVLIGYYSGISKISQVITMLFYPIGQALYPYHSKKFDESFESGYISVKKVSKFIIPFFILLAFLLILFRNQVVNLILGSEYLNASNLLMIIAFLPLFSILSNILGTQVIVASGHTKEYSRAFIKGSIFSILFYFIFGYFFSIWGVAIASLLGAILNLIFLYYEIIGIKKKHKIHQ